MIDEHILPNPNWGIKPVLFELFDLPIFSYSFFVLLGLIIGIIVFYYNSKNKRSLNESTFYILLAAVIGGILGAKIPIWIINFKQILLDPTNLSLILSGRTIVGGIIGGTISVYLIKKILRIKERKGNLFAPSMAIGIAVGRIGCFLRGCCYGKSTDFFWGVNFGDNILRHPTQLYESIFCLILFFYLQFKIKKDKDPGKLFQIFMISYFSFRFLIEFIRVEPIIFLGLTGFQWISLFVVIFYLYKFHLKKFIKR